MNNKSQLFILASAAAAISTYLLETSDHYQYRLTKDPNKNVEIVLQASKKVFNGSVIGQLAAAQAILESNLYGKPSKLALQGNNLFGIKYNPKVNKEYVELDTTECYKGKCSKVKAKFAKYQSAFESFEALKTLYATKPRYQILLNAKSCQEAGYLVQKAGYATDPSYGKKIANICSKYVVNVVTSNK